MASPFRTFRKHQKALIAVLALLSMVAFVVLPIWMDTMGTQGGGNPVVVSTTRYGDVDQMQLSALLQNRQWLRGFLRQVGQAVAMTQSNPYFAQYLALQIENLFGPADEEDVVETWVLARRAEELGVVISDAAVNDFLRRITTEQGLTGEQVKQILASVQLSQNQLFDLVKQELLAQKLQDLFLSSLLGTTPAERWDYYQRLNRRVTAEVVPLEVAEFVGQVPEPDEKALAEFFEKHKEQAFVPGSPEPGFLVPKKVALEYFKADYERLPEIVEVAEAEISAYYEENKEQLYRKEKLPEFPEEKPAAEQPAPTADPEASPAAAADDKPAAEQPAPATAEKPAADKGEEGEMEEGAAPDPGEEPAAAKPAAEEPAAEAVPPKESSSSLWAGRLHLVASEQSEPAEESPPAAEPQAASDAAPEYVPLGEVADEIRRRLAQQKIQEVLARLRDKMAAFHDDWIVYQALPAEEKVGKSPPEKLDVAALAEQNRLSAHRTELISAFELEELDIGKSTVDRGAPLATYVFETVPEYRPGMSQDDDGNYYLFWKTGQTDQSVPDWSDPQVRANALQAWKIVHARELAMTEAERLSGEARESGKPLEEFFADQPNRKALATGSFSWLTYGAVPPSQARTPPRISEVNAWVTDPATGKLSEQPAVEVPGEEFMRAVTRLDAGEVCAVMNAPETAAYVVRVTAVEPAPYQLYDRFVATPLADYAMVARADYDQAVESWRSGIHASVGLKWQREPIRSR